MFTFHYDGMFLSRCTKNEWTDDRYMFVWMCLIRPTIHSIPYSRIFLKVWYDHILSFRAGNPFTLACPYESEDTYVRFTVQKHNMHVKMNSPRIHCCTKPIPLACQTELGSVLERLDSTARSQQQELRALSRSVSKWAVLFLSSTIFEWSVASAIWWYGFESCLSMHPCYQKATQSILTLDLDD